MKISKKELERRMEDKADQQYQGVAPDLPSHGNFHYQSAIDHLSDYLYDHFSKEHSGAPFHKIAKRVVSRYCSSDTAESNRNEKKRERRWKKASKKKAQQPKRLFIKSWDSKKPSRLGVGSY